MPYASTEFRQARVTAGFKPGELAAKIGRSEGHLRNVERGDKPMLDVYFSRVATLLGCSMAELIADPPNEPRMKAAS